MFISSKLKQNKNEAVGMVIALFFLMKKNNLVLVQNRESGFVNFKVKLVVRIFIVMPEEDCNPGSEEPC